MLHRRSLTASLLFALLLPVTAFAFDVPPNDGFVTDTVHLLTAEEKSSIESTIADYRSATSNEIAVVILPTLGGEPIEEVSLEIGRKWGVGSTKNNGILLLIAYDDHLVRIDVGYGLEGAVPDLVAKGIIETDIVPAFRDAKYATGISSAIASLQKHIGGEFTAERYAEPAENFGSLPYFFLLLFFALQWILVVLSRTKSWWLGGLWGGIAAVILTAIYGWWLSIPVLVVLGLLLDFLVSRNYQKRGPTSWWAGGGWGPGGSSGSGGGGFGGFGGGSFGGGGASGRW